MVGTFAALVVSPAALLFLVVAFALLVPILMLAPAREYGNRAPDCRRPTVASALGVAIGTSAFVGFAAILGAAAFALALLVLVTSPYALSACGHRLGSALNSTRSESEAPARTLTHAIQEEAPAQPVSGLPHLTNEQLCHAWRDSCATLQEQSSETAFMHAVEERQSYVDEMERRNASGLTAWLASGAMATGDPLPYLIDHRADHRAVNWDELIWGQGR
jgi:hypothetical protein